MRTNPVLPAVLFSRLSPDSGKLLPMFVNQAVHVCNYDVTKMGFITLLTKLMFHLKVMEADGGFFL